MSGSRTLVVFDMDDTLYLERNYVKSGFRAVGKFLNEEFGVSGAERGAWNDFVGGVRGNAFDRLLDRANLPASLVSTLVDVYRSHSPEIYLEDDALVCLDGLHGRVFLGLITDGFPASQRLKIQALGIEKYFDEIIVTGEYGDDWAKPSDKAFALLQKKLGVADSRCIYVADNPLKDFKAPRRLGWSALRVRRPGGIYEHESCSPEMTQVESIEAQQVLNMIASAHML